MLGESKREGGRESACELCFLPNTSQGLWQQRLNSHVLMFNVALCKLAKNYECKQVSERCSCCLVWEDGVRPGPVPWDPVVSY